MAPANSSNPRFDRAARRWPAEATVTTKQRKINSFYSALQQWTSLLSFFCQRGCHSTQTPAPSKYARLFLIISPLSWTNMSASTKTQAGWINCRIKHQTASDSAIWTFLDCFYLLWFNCKYTDDKAQSCQKVFLTFSSSVFICPTAALSLLK